MTFWQFVFVIIALVASGLGYILVIGSRDYPDEYEDEHEEVEK